MTIELPAEPWAPKGFRNLAYAITLEAHGLALPRLTPPIEPPRSRRLPIEEQAGSEEYAEITKALDGKQSYPQPRLRAKPALPYDDFSHFSDMVLAGEVDLRRALARVERNEDEYHRREITQKHNAKRNAEYESTLKKMMAEARGIIATKLENRELRCVTFDGQGKKVSVPSEFWRSDEGKLSISTGKKDGRELYVERAYFKPTLHRTGKSNERGIAKNAISFFVIKNSDMKLTKKEILHVIRESRKNISEEDFKCAYREFLRDNPDFKGKSGRPTGNRETFLKQAIELLKAAHPNEFRGPFTMETSGQQTSKKT